MRSEPSRVGELSIAPVKMLVNGNLIWEQGSRGVETKANPDWCSADSNLQSLEGCPREGGLVS